ncbi:MAG: hydroxymethylglutaryl-CoA lyase [Cytophagales bacterium]|nr:hydroxymethylglutaryl-CoA lyase [Cytophaga sp.]
MNSNTTHIKLIECPRDAMQGVPLFIPTDIKAAYINKLLRCGFHTIDFGSFVSPKAIPQMRDTADVFDLLNLEGDRAALLSIIANERGAKQALQYSEIDYLGFPLSISETFQQRNTNKSIEEAFETVDAIQHLCIRQSKNLVVYLSMGFGNPYGEPYDPAIVQEFVQKLDQLEITTISLSDTIGSSEPEGIKSLFRALMPAFPHIEFGAHFHSRPELSKSKIQAALDAGCNRIDSTMKGIGGCPMANDHLVGNIDTELLLSELDWRNIKTGIHQEQLSEAAAIAFDIFIK